MTREEALKKLEPFIPSLKRDYCRWGEKKVDKTKDRSWLYRDESYRKPSTKWNDPDKERYMPEVIPQDFLEGLTVEVGGESYVAERSKEYNYRRVYLEVTDFALYGNTHKYGKLEIDGLHWVKKGECGYHSWGRLSDEEPRVTGIWDVDLFRIVGEGEMAGSECPPLEATARFVYLDELVATAAYVTLLRIEGPFILDNASSYAAVREAKDILVTVDENGNVVWGEKIKRILKLN